MVRRYRGTEGVGGISIGGGSTSTLVLAGSVSIDPPSIAAGVRAAVTFTLTGAKVGDTVLLNPPALAAGLIFSGAAVTAADTVTVYLYNPTAGAIDDAALTWRYRLERFA